MEAKTSVEAEYIQTRKTWEYVTTTTQKERMEKEIFKSGREMNYQEQQTRDQTDRKWVQKV